MPKYNKETYATQAKVRKQLAQSTSSPQLSMKERVAKQLALAKQGATRRASIHDMYAQAGDIQKRTQSAQEKTMGIIKKLKNKGNAL